MRLLNVKNHKLSEYFEPDIPPYAILSHRWEAEEVTYVDLHGPDWKQKAGAQKILSACRQACANDLAWIWIDTCCIDKSSSAELSEAINSMFRWYAECKICYAFLSDVVLSKVNLVTTAEHEDLSFSPYRVQFLKSAWFTRGWTLQEMIAPDNVEFFCRDWFCIGTRRSLAAYITQACGVDTELLDRNPFHRDIFRRDDFDSIETALQKYSIAQKMSWAAMRKTSRIEDRAYSLLGLFGVNIPMLYGEGERAFFRLQEAILRHGSDLSILAFAHKRQYPDGLLAKSPYDFVDCHDVVLSYSPDTTTRIVYSMMNNKITIERPVLSFESADKRRVDLSLECQKQGNITDIISLRLRKSHSDASGFQLDKTSQYSTTRITDTRQSPSWPSLTILLDAISYPILKQNAYTHVWTQLPCTTEGSPWQVGEFYPEHCWNFANITFDFSKFDDRLDTSSSLSLSHGSKTRPDPYLKEMIRKGKWGAIALSNEEHGEFAIHFLHIPSAIDGAYEELLFKISEYNSSNFAKFPSALVESAIEFAESRTDVLQRQSSILTAKGQLILVRLKAVERSNLLVALLELIIHNKPSDTCKKARL